MASEAEAVTKQSKEGYKTFCILFTTATVGVLLLLALMAIFLI